MKHFYPFLFVLALSMGLGSCSKLTDQSYAPQPIDTVVAPLGKILLQADSLGRARISLDSLHVDNRYAFTLRGSGFLYGHIVLDGQSVFYEPTSVPTPQNPARTDSGQIELYQMGVLHSGLLIVRSHLTPIDTMPSITCREIIGRLQINMAIPGNATLLTAPVGYKFVEAQARFYTARFNEDSTQLVYNPSGGAAGLQGLTMAEDEVFYRISNGDSCKSQWINLRLGDPCRVIFEDVRTGLTSTQLRITHTSLLARQANCDNSAIGAASLRLSLARYTPPLRMATAYGTITDTVDNGVPLFIYRTTAPLRADEVEIFMQEGPDERISSGKLKIQP